MRIVFPCTARPHLARQQLLVNELRKRFEVEIFEPEPVEGSMTEIAISYSKQFNDFLKKSLRSYDLALIRGDRFELLGIAMVCAYSEIPIIHLEAGDESGVIDNKVRHAISKLADYHFPTNKESLIRLVNMGIDPDKVWNYGSLDVEYAFRVPAKKLRDKPYFLVAYHCISGEDEGEINKALSYFHEREVIKIKGNKDYGRQYGDEEYPPEDYINLLRHADCLIGNSSSFLKEASIFGTPVILVGDRQKNRLKSSNVFNVSCEWYKIKSAIEYQLQMEKKPDYLYYRLNTSIKITNKIEEIFHNGPNTKS